MKAHYCNFCSLAQNKRPPIKKESTIKHKGAQNKRPPIKKEATTKHNGLKMKDLRRKKRQSHNAMGSK
jgi:hypothetical protein